jgi:hypothetical protein
MDGDMRLRIYGTARAIAAILYCQGAAAQETPAEARLFGDAATACFAAGIPSAGPLDPASQITSLLVRARIPALDGDGAYPPDVEDKLEPARPDQIRLTLAVAFANGGATAPSGRRWGARFLCEPKGSGDGHLVCNVDDWCADVGFDLRIEGNDALIVDVLPDAGSVGELGDPCGDTPRHLLVGASNAFVSYRLDRRPAEFCR